MDGVRSRLGEFVREGWPRGHFNRVDKPGISVSVRGVPALHILGELELLVHGVAVRAEAVTKARQTVDVDGMWGNRVVIEKISPGRLPHADNTVDLVVATKVR